ncbi:hypothetical protein Tco_0471848 [Tanacetum coccineum]
MEGWIELVEVEGLRGRGGGCRGRVDVGGMGVGFSEGGFSAHLNRIEEESRERISCCVGLLGLVFQGWSSVQVGRVSWSATREVKSLEVRSQPIETGGTRANHAWKDGMIGEYRMIDRTKEEKESGGKKKKRIREKTNKEEEGKEEKGIKGRKGKPKNEDSKMVGGSETATDTEKSLS